MYCLVLGNSGTAGHGLTLIAEAWPAQLADRLGACSKGHRSVTAVRLWPAGDRAVRFALDCVRDRSPEVVIVSINAFPCVVPVVAESIRARLGDQSARIYGAAERRAGAAAAGSGTLGAWLHARSRHFAHRVLGARPYLSVDDVGRVYADILHGLAREEGLRVIALAEARFSVANQRRYPHLLPSIERLHAIVRPAAEIHHFCWLDIEPAFRTPSKEELWLPDGVHMTAAGNRRYAEVLATELAAGENPSGGD